jgi:hypothetical protein
MVTSKKGGKGSKKAGKRSSTSPQDEVKNFFNEHQSAFLAVKKKHKAVVEAASKLGVAGKAKVAESVATLDALGDIADQRLDPDYTLIDPEGNVVPRKRVVDHIRKFGTFEDYKRTKHSVRVFGNTALSVSQVTMGGIFEGHDIKGQYRETHLLVKRNGTWYLLNTHMTLVQPMSKLFAKVADKDVSG